MVIEEANSIEVDEVVGGFWAISKVGHLNEKLFWHFGDRDDREDVELCATFCFTWSDPAFTATLTINQVITSAFWRLKGNHRILARPPPCDVEWMQPSHCYFKTVEDLVDRIYNKNPLFQAHWIGPCGLRFTGWDKIKTLNNCCEQVMHQHKFTPII